MPTDLVIEGIDSELLAQLKARADRHGRALGEEVLLILAKAVGGSPRLTPAEVLKEVTKRGLSSPSESVAMIRAHRDA